MYNKNIVLIGFMGCGKTTIGKQLAKNCNMTFFDTDFIIQQQQNKTIQQIFEQFGEKYFRILEKQTCLNLLDVKNSVISTGGGIIKCKECMESLKKNGYIIYLKATPEKIYQNLINDENRPLLKNKDKILTIKELLNEREKLYIKYADMIYDIKDSSPFILAKNLKNNIYR